MVEDSDFKAGEARVRAEYLLPIKAQREIDLNHVTPQDRVNVEDLADANDEVDDVGSKRRKFKLKGQNKKRKFKKSEKRNFEFTKKPCLKFVSSIGNGIDPCPYGNECKYGHDLDDYLAKNSKYNSTNECYNFSQKGYCQFGVLCCYASSHVDPKDKISNIVNAEKWNKSKCNPTILNHISREITFQLRRKSYNFEKSNSVSTSIPEGEFIGPIVFDDDSMPRKAINFKDKLYLAPLTTIGNLPFRRICKEFGADITCGEMAMASNLLDGQASEWALLRRHRSESIFGVQLCGGNVDNMTRATQLINENCDVDFIDINMGCPIDCVYQRGMGSGLLNKINKLNHILFGMTKISKVPITLKMRTGTHAAKNTADKIVKNVCNHWDNKTIGLFTLHGRSREQRYTKSADWSYVNEVAELSPEIPVFGSGDVLSYTDYYNNLETYPNIAGVMLGRGAIIKPWIFTEIKEKRHWDISSKERLEILQNFANYGLEHWGSDTSGVEKTRRFLCEWLSFLYRYIPVGILEVLPQKINQRPPSYKGRDELETLMASPSCTDWIKLSEIVLGPVSSDFVFIPKHKANAYSSG